MTSSRVVLPLLLAALSAAPARATESKLPEVPQDVASPSLSPQTQGLQTAPAPVDLSAPLQGVELNSVVPSVQPVQRQAQAEQTKTAAPSAQAQVQRLADDAGKMQASLSPQKNDPVSAKATGDQGFDLRHAQSGTVGDAVLGAPTSPLPSGLQPYTPRSPSEPGGYSRERGLRAILEEAVAKGDLTSAQREQWEQLAYVDPLTGMRNRLYLDDHVDALVGSHESLESVKLDFLKEINDRFDHETGNKVLTAMAAVSRRVAGSDAFLVRRSPTGVAVFVKLSPSRARYVAEALRVAVEQKLGGVIPGEGPSAEEMLAGTINVGVAPIPTKGSAKERYAAAFTAAEEARRYAKDAGGGNRVAVDDGGPRLMDRLLAEETVAQVSRDLPALGKRLAALPKEDLDAIVAQAKSRSTVRASQLLNEVKDASLHRALFESVYLDRLTGLPNRRWLFDHLSDLVGLGGFTHYTALDLDRFGGVNSRYGEEKADLVLREFGRILGDAARSEGAVALHLSGEEFVLLSKGQDVDARALAERVRLRVRAELGPRAAALGVVDEEGRPLTLTASFGVGRVEPAQGTADHVLTLATAMAEAMLHRAKENGRDRVESPEALEAIVKRVLRMDETARRAIKSVLESASAPAPAADELFGNGWRSRAEVLAAEGYNPGVQPGALLSEPGKGGSEVYRIQAQGKPSRVIKIADERVISNELFGREVLRGFEAFNAHLYSADAVAYRRWFQRPIMVMRDMGPAERGEIEWDTLPLAQKQAFALLALTFGLHGFNGKALVEGSWTRSAFVDFEYDRVAVSPASPNRIPLIGEMPWVSRWYLNDLADYHDAIARWKTTFARPQTQRELEAMLRKAGVGERSIEVELALFRENLGKLEAALEADIQGANRLYREDCRRAGLDDEQAEALSAINKAAHVSPGGGVARDIVRFLNRRNVDAGPSRRTLALDPREFHLLAVTRQKGLKAEDRAAVLRAAEAGRLGPYPVETVREALRELDRSLPPARH